MLSKSKGILARSKFKSIKILSTLAVASFTFSCLATGAHAAAPITEHTITTDLKLKVLDSGAPAVPSTGYLTDGVNTAGNAESMFFALLPILIPFVLAALLIIFLIIRKRQKQPKFRTLSQKKFAKVARTSAILLALTGLAIHSILPYSANAAETTTTPLVTLAFVEQPGTVQVGRGETLSEAAVLKVSVSTESLNDLELNVDFTNKNSHIQLSTKDAVITLPAGTTSKEVPVSVKISAEATPGEYSEQIGLTARIKEGFWRTVGRDVVDSNGYVKLLKAFNIGENVTVWWDNETPNLDLMDVAHTDFAYTELASLGVNAVRFHFKARSLADNCTTSFCLTYDYKEEVFNIFDKILANAAAHNIGVIFNIHNSYGDSHGIPTAPKSSKLDTFLPENLAKTTELWKDIAARFKDDKRILGFDLMNEPMVRLEDNETINDAYHKWNNAAQNMIDAIRSVDNNHMIIVEQLNRATKINGGAQISRTMSEHGFPAVTDPMSNVMYEFHDYGNWDYVSQSDEQVANDPWVWPNTNFMGVVGEGMSSYISEAWPRAILSGTNPQSIWTEISTTNGNPASVNTSTTTPPYNLASVNFIIAGNLNSDTIIYLDGIKVDEYEQDGTHIRTVYEQNYRTSADLYVSSNSSKVTIEQNQSLCHDSNGGCLKISGPTTSSLETFSQNLRFFKIDSTKKYKLTAHAYGENMPSNLSIQGILAYTYGSDEQVRPYDKSYLNEKVQKYVKFSEENNVPIFNGEFGVLKNGEVWDKIGAKQYIQDSLDVFKENNINAAYFEYYDKNGAAAQRRPGLRVREYNIPSTEPVTAENSTLNTKLYDVFMRNR